MQMKRKKLGQWWMLPACLVFAGLVIIAYIPL
jgi:hypothetical protein